MRDTWVFGLLTLLFGADLARADSPTASAADGVRWRSDEIELHLGGVYAGGAILHDDRIRGGDSLHTDLAHVLLDGRFARELSFRIAFDLEGTDSRYGLDEAFVAWQPRDSLRFSGGLLELPLGFESGYREEDLPLIDHAFGHWLASRTDWAARSEGELGEGAFGWDLALAAGAGFDREGEKRGDPRVSLRLYTFPFRGWRGFDGFFLAAGYAHSPDFDGQLDVRNPSHTMLFQTGDLDGERSRFYTAAVGFALGPVLLYYQGVQGGIWDVDSPFGDQDLDDQIDSWHATLAWRITGEPYEARPFHQRDDAARWRPEGRWGGWEVALRYANGDIDRRFFDFGLTDFARSSQEFRAVTVALGWQPHPALRLVAQYVRTQADQDIRELGFQGRDNAFELRALVRF